MADERTKIDVNQVHTIAGLTYDSNEEIMNLTLNPVDKRLRVDASITSDYQDPFNGYGLYAMLDDATTTYIMHQNTSGAWICQKIIDATGITVYAKGDSEAGTAWTNRASQSYNDYDVTFS